MAIHSCILALEIPCTEELGRLQSMGLQRDITEHTHTAQQYHHLEEFGTPRSVFLTFQ